MKRFFIAASAVLALSFVGSSFASAQHHGRHSGYGYGGRYSSPRLSVSVGYGNFGHYSGHSGYGRHQGYGQHPGFGGYQVYGGHGHSSWHDTSHLDYHGPSLVPHRGHFDYVPGHYDVHRTGHWDHHGH